MAAVLENSASVEHGTSETSHTLSFGFTATSGRLLISVLGVDKSSGTITIPSGYTLVNGYDSASVSASIAFKVSAGTETDVAWSWVESKVHSVWIGEWSGLTSSPLDVKAEDDSGSCAVQSQASGTTANTTAAVELAFGYWTADSAGNVTGGHTYTNSFTEIVFVGGPTSGVPPVIIATKNLTATGAQSSVFETSDTGDQMYGSMTTFKETVATAFMPTLALAGVGF